MTTIYNFPMKYDDINNVNHSREMKVLSGVETNFDYQLQFADTCNYFTLQQIENKVESVVDLNIVISSSDVSDLIDFNLYEDAVLLNTKTVSAKCSSCAFSYNQTVTFKQGSVYQLKIRSNNDTTIFVYRIFAILKGV
jgi:hypothetical protein